MKLAKYAILLLALMCGVLTAQDKNLSVEDVIYNAYGKLMPQTPERIQWIPGTEEYTFLEENNSLVKTSADADEVETIVTLEDLSEKIVDAGGNKTNRFPRLEWENETSFVFWSGNKLFRYSTENESVTQLAETPSDAENKDVAPGNGIVAFTIGNDLYVSGDNSEGELVAKSDSAGIVYGQYVHRREFGITKGTFWSPEGNYLAFYRKDESMVTDYPIVDITPLPAKLESIKYPMAGQKSHHATVGVYNVESGKTVYLKTGEPAEQYLTNITWSPDEKYIYVAHLNRGQDHMRLIRYDAATGEQDKLLFEEKDDKYVEPEHDLIFLPNDNEKFLWWSERDGYDHLYLYNTEGELLHQVTKGEWVVLSTEGFDESGENIFITSTKESPIERHFYKVNIASGDMKKLTEGKGTHSVLRNEAGNMFIDRFTSLEIPMETRLIDKEGDIEKVLMESGDPLKEYRKGNVEIFTIKNDEGTELYCRTVTPPDLDKTKKYPVVVYVYGGPHVQNITDRYPMGRYDLWAQLMAEKGYIVFTLDNRGSANRGRDFEQATFRRLGTYEVEDQLAGIDYLKSLSYVDTSRMGVFGWSYGGFMTTSLMLRGNNTFKVGVGGGAVIDWKFYEIMYTERYMDTPEDNPEGYEEASLLNYVDNLNGKLLLVHGTSDPTVVWQQTLAFAQKAANLNKPLDYYPYVGHEHGVYGKDAVHLYNKITNYFLDNL